MVSCYYLSQEEWGAVNFNALHRYMSKMIENHDNNRGSIDGLNRIEEIKCLDLSRMSETTHVLLFCIVKWLRKDFLLDLPNLLPLKDVRPLSVPVQLTEKPLKAFSIYEEYGIIY